MHRVSTLTIACMLSYTTYTRHLCALLLLCAMSSCEQAGHQQAPVEQEQSLCDCFVRGDATIPLYNEMLDRVTDSVSNDLPAEIIYFGTLTASGPLANKVRLSSIAGDTVTGYLPVEGSPLGVYFANYTGAVTIYAAASEESAVVYVLEDYLPAALQLLHCTEGWSYIHAAISGQEVTGWVKNTALCANPYSTCS